MVGALLLGWVVGYERYFSGRASGSQVYCLVCATSCAIALLAGYPSLWYWGTAHPPEGGDPTRVIGSILTGIGFLGAGIIVQISMSIVPRIEHLLPARASMAGTVRFRDGYTPEPELIHRYLAERGMSIPPDSLTISSNRGRFELRCLIFVDTASSSDAMGRIVLELAAMDGIESFSVTHASRA
jgi:putative Mg2+ transporter-C (MgtC) family protein